MMMMVVRLFILYIALYFVLLFSYTKHSICCGDSVRCECDVTLFCGNFFFLLGTQIENACPFLPLSNHDNIIICINVSLWLTIYLHYDLRSSGKIVATSLVQSINCFCCNCFRRVTVFVWRLKYSRYAFRTSS